MTNLDELLNIARAATPGPWEVLDAIEPFNKVCVSKQGHFVPTIEIKSFVHRDFDMRLKDGIFIATFNPRLIEKMLAEIKAGREFRDSAGDWTIEDKHWRNAGIFDKAREALDNEIKGVV